MPQSSWPLNTTGNVTLDASGNGTVQLRPDGPQEHWALSLASFKTAQTVITNEAQCRIYIGPQVADQYFVDGTLSGSTGDSTGKVANGYDISRTGPLPSIWAVWTGGDPGAIATLSISGTASFGAGGASPFSAGEGCSNPIIGGGGALVYPSIHSPNFVTGSTGWSINKNGTAEFNSLVVRGGTIISGVFLQYSSAIPAKGNLVMAFAPMAGGTDAVGNVYPQGWNWGKWNASGAITQHFGIDTSGNLYLCSPTGAIVMYGNTNDGSLEFYNSSGLGVGNLLTSIAPAAGTDPDGNNYPQGLNVTKGSISGTTFSGTDFIINTTGQFFYSGAPAANNLISTDTNAAGVDSFGNNYLAGKSVYNNSAGLALSMSAGGLNGFSGSLAAGWGVSVASFATLSAGWLVGGPLAFKGQATPSTPSAGDAVLYATTAGTPAEVLPSGWQGELVSSLAPDFTNFTVTAAGLTQCTKAWSIPADDAQVGTTYRMTFIGNGTQGTTAEVLSFQILGVAGSLAAISQTFAGVSANFNFKVVLEITIVTTGAAGTANYHVWASAGGGNNSGYTQAAINTTSAFTFEGEGKWGSAAVACTFTSFQSYFERIGP